MLFEIKTNFDIVELGDIFITNDEKIRMVIRDDYTYATINLEGRICTGWYDSIEELIENYNIRKVYKNNKLKIVKEENQDYGKENI